MEYVLRTSNLTKTFSKHCAVDNVSLHIKRGEIYGFIGRNGAGKTTFMKMISGLSVPTAGEIELFGEKMNNISKYKSRIGNLIEAPGIYPNMSGRSNLRCKSLALGIHREGYEDKLLEMVGLNNVGNKKVKNYSLGMKQRLGIAFALVGEPDFLILDEPINGLDPQGIAEIRDILLKLKAEKNMTILISSHILEELSKIADTFGIINEGRLIQEISAEDLMNKCSDYIELKLDNASRATTILDKLGFNDYKVTDKETICIYDQLDRSGELNSELVQNGCMVKSISVVQEKLEDYFLKLTGGDKDA